MLHLYVPVLSEPQSYLKYGIFLLECLGKLRPRDFLQFPGKHTDAGQ